MLTSSRARLPRMDREDASIYQQIKKSHYNKYSIELACPARIGEYWSFAGLWTSPAARSMNLPIL